MPRRLPAYDASGIDECTNFVSSAPKMKNAEPQRREESVPEFAPARRTPSIYLGSRSRMSKLFQTRVFSFRGLSMGYEQKKLEIISSLLLGPKETSYPKAGGPAPLTKRRGATILDRKCRNVEKKFR
jgi:hypothetical protein